MLAGLGFLYNCLPRPCPLHAHSTWTCISHDSGRGYTRSSTTNAAEWGNRDNETYQVDLSTGFPVALGYRSSGPGHPQHWLSWRDQRHSNLPSEPRTAHHLPEEHGALDEKAEVWPVFRTSPYRAEAARRARGSSTTRILFVDEGHGCRSVLAEAIMTDLLASCGRALDVSVASASVGPAPPGEHDEEVLMAAAEAGIALGPRVPRVFDEVVDIVNFDLVLVLDHFDLTEVVREVAVLDNINPGGLYAARVKLLARFAPDAAVFPGHPSLEKEDIPDPLYARESGDGIVTERARLRASVAQIRSACAGLLRHLLDLSDRCAAGVPLPAAVQQALQCPLLVADAGFGAQRCTVAPVLRRQRVQNPVWREGGATAEEDGGVFFTIRTVNGQQRVVRRPAKARRRSRSRGYWHDAANVEAELRAFTATHSIAGRLPIQAEVAAAGDHALNHAVAALGGYRAMAARMGLQPARRTNGYWASVDNLRRELEAEAVHGVVSTDDDNAQLAATSRPQGLGEAAPCQAAISIRDLRANGRGDLLQAIHSHGGPSEVSKSLGLACTTMPSKRRLHTLGSLSLEFEAVVPHVLQYGVMPNQAQLLEADRPDLVQAVRRMGGFKRVAAALELAFLPARRGRSQAPAWAPETAHPSLTLVQFSSPPRGGQHDLGSDRGSCADTASGLAGTTAAGGEAAVQLRPAALVTRRLSDGDAQQLASEQQARAGDGRVVVADSRVTDGGPSALEAAYDAVVGERQGLARRLGGGPEKNKRVVGGEPKLEAQPALKQRLQDRVSAASAHRSTDLCSGTVEESNKEADLVAPLLRSVAKDVQQFASSCGIARMPTKQEMRGLGRPDLALAVVRCGGVRAVAQHLGMAFKETRGRKPKGA